MRRVRDGSRKGQDLEGSGLGRSWKVPGGSWKGHRRVLDWYWEDSGRVLEGCIGRVLEGSGKGPRRV